MDIKVLGSGCSNCLTLEERVNEALQSLDEKAVVSKVTDFGDIASWGVMSTPALVINDQVVVVGRVPSVGELATILGDAG